MSDDLHEWRFRRYLATREVERDYDFAALNFEKKYPDGLVALIVVRRYYRRRCGACRAREWGLPGDPCRGCGAPADDPLMYGPDPARTAHP